MLEGAFRGPFQLYFHIAKEAGSSSSEGPCCRVFYSCVREWPWWPGALCLPRGAVRSLHLYLISSSQKKQQKSNVITLVFRGPGSARTLWLSKGKCCFMTHFHFSWLSHCPSLLLELPERVWLHSWALGVYLTSVNWRELTQRHGSLLSPPKHHEL